MGPTARLTAFLLCCSATAAFVLGDDPAAPSRPVADNPSRFLRAMQVFEDGDRLWVFAGESVPNYDPRPSHLNVILLDPTGIASVHRFRTTVEINTADAGVFRHAGVIYVFAADSTPTGRIFRLGEAGFVPLAAEEEAAMRRVVGNAADYEVPAGVAEVAKGGGLFRISPPTDGLGFPPVPVESKKTGYLVEISKDRQSLRISHPESGWSATPVLIAAAS